MAPKDVTTIRAHDDGPWIPWLGHPVKILATGDETGGQYSASIGIASRGQGAPLHAHEFDESFYLLSGEVDFHAGSDVVSLSEGDFIHIRGGTAHRPSVTSEHAELLTLTFPSGFAAFQIEASGGSTYRTREAAMESGADVEKIRARVTELAPSYGIDMSPSDAATERPGDVSIVRRTEGELVDAVGDRYRFLAAASDTSDRYGLWHATVTPGGDPPPHRHLREAEAFFVLSGEIEFHADGVAATVGAGGFVHLPAGSTHRFVNPTGEPAETLILVAPGELEAMFRRTGEIVTDATTPIAPGSDAEKRRLVEIAPEYGLELILPATD